MKAINFKLATFTFAAMLFASCSDSNENPVSPGGTTPDIVGEEVSSITDAATLAARVYNYKSSATNTARSRVIDTNMFKGVLTMAEEPKVPADAKPMPTEPWKFESNTNYVQEGNTEQGIQLANNSTIYVKGTLKITENCYGGNSTIIILKGGKLINNVGSNFLNNNNNIKVYNYGTIESTDSKIDIGNNTTLYSATTLDFPNQDVSCQAPKLYVGGDLKCKSFTPMNGALINIVGDFLVPNQDLAFEGNMHVGGKFEVKSLELRGVTNLYSDCSIQVAGKLNIIAGTCSMHAKHISAGEIYQCSNSSLTLQDGGVVECKGTWDCDNNGNGSCVDLTGDNAKALVKVHVLYYNGSKSGNEFTPCYMFKASGTDSFVYIDVDGIRTKNGETASKYEEAAWGGNTKNYVGHEQVVDVKESSCGGKEIEQLPEDTKKDLDVVGEVTYDHTHDISATCIQPYNGKLYMSYHTRGTGQGGCLEVFETGADKNTRLLQYLQDKKHIYDFNHLMIDSKSSTPYLYAVGNNKGAGAMLARIALNQNGLMDTETKDIDETTTLNPLTIVKLFDDPKTDSEKSSDENAIVRDGDKLLIASTRGYEVYDPNTLKLVGNKPTPGKAKHIAIQGNEIATLYYNESFGKNQASLPASGKVEVFNTGDDILTATPKKTINVSEIVPNNGKNTIAIDGNNIYVCRSADGLTCYDKNTGTEKWTWQAPLTATTQQPQGYANGVTYDANYVYLACGGYGIVVLDKNKMDETGAKPAVVAKARVTGAKNDQGKIVNNSANYVTLYNGYIYVAYGKNRLKVYQLVDRSVNSTSSKYNTDKK